MESVVVCDAVEGANSASISASDAPVCPGEVKL